MAFLAGFGIVVLFIIISIPLSILSGAVLMKLWEWFLIPLGLPGLELAHAIGIAIIISYMTSSARENKDQEQDTTKTLIAACLKPFFALLFGYIVKSFM